MPPMQHRKVVKTITATDTLMRASNFAPYEILNRKGRRDMVHPSPDGSFKVLPKVAGAATAPTPSSTATAAATAINNYLAIAPKKYVSIVGSVPSGSSGGSTSNVTWQRDIPTIPAFCTALDYEITLPVTLTLGATTGAATLSPFAPYSAVANQLTLGGAPPWPLTELTPWHIDSTMHRVDYDSAYTGLGNQSDGSFSGVLDTGPSPVAFSTAAGGLNPGAKVTNLTASPVSTNYTFTFKVRLKLQRKRHLLWGAVPFGDPRNRPLNITQVLPLVGINPEQSLFVNGTLATAVLNGPATFTAVYELSYIDLLPPNISAAPTPAVSYGLQLITSSPSGLVAGALTRVSHRTAMTYTSIHDMLVNGELPIQSDYFGLWDDEDQQSARWSYDAQENTFNEYFSNYHRINRRYPYKGVYTTEMDDGEFPEVPSVTPYNGLMSPDQVYASDFGIPLTPAMTTTLRIPSGTALSNPYIRTYSFGLVRVPY